MKDESSDPPPLAAFMGGGSVYAVRQPDPFWSGTVP